MTNNNIYTFRLCIYCICKNVAAVAFAESNKAFNWAAGDPATGVPPGLEKLIRKHYSVFNFTM
jgi:hypothetical protein